MFYPKCFFLSPRVLRAPSTDSEWIFGLSFGVAWRLLTVPAAASVYAIATEAAIGLVIFAFFISHFIHRLLTVIVWIQV